MAKVRAYIRCSTNEDRQDLQRQVRELEKQHQVDRYYKEFGSGSKLDRIEYNNMLEDLEAGDTIVATEVSRLSRSTKQFIDLLELVKTKGLKLIVGTMVIDCRDNAKMDAMTEATLKIMSVFSELEKQMTSERVKSGMENAREKGVKLGRPEATTEDVPQKFKDNYKLYLDKKINVTDLAKINGISRTTVYKYIKLLKDAEQETATENVEQEAETEQDFRKIVQEINGNLAYGVSLKDTCLELGLDKAEVSRELRDKGYKRIKGFYQLVEAEQERE